jgi:hypothetical protein
MLNNLIKKIKSATGVFADKKMFSVFIGAGASCPCLYFFNITKDLKNADAFIWDNPDEKNLPNSNLNNGIFIYAHGDLDRLESFYYTKESIRKYISDRLWNKFSVNSKLTYFHVCFGSQIIANNNTLRNKFPYWVSYSGEIIVLKSTKFPELEEFYKDLLNEILNAAFKAQSPMELELLIKEINRNMKGKIRLQNNLRNMLIATIGNNMQYITHSA